MATKPQHSRQGTCALPATNCEDPESRFCVVAVNGSVRFRWHVNPRRRRRAWWKSTKRSVPAATANAISSVRLIHNPGNTSAPASRVSQCRRAPAEVSHWFIHLFTHSIHLPNNPQKPSSTSWFAKYRIISTTNHRNLSQISTSVGERECANLGNVSTQLDRSVATVQRDFDRMAFTAPVSSIAVAKHGWVYSNCALFCCRWWTWRPPSTFRFESGSERGRMAKRKSNYRPQILLPPHLSLYLSLPPLTIQMSTSACCVIITGRARTSARTHTAHSNVAAICKEPFWPPMDSDVNTWMTAKRITADVRTRA